MKRTASAIRPETRSAARGMTATDRELATLARALGHPARVAILKALIECGECVCGTIVSFLPLAQATVSQHLKVLKEAGLIEGEVDGPRVCYCVNPKVVKRLQQLIHGLSREEEES